MLENFRDAAERHWEDAEHLFANTRLANSDHLFGLSGECALKAIMKGLGMTLTADGAPTDKQHRVHINLLWNEFVTFAHNRGGARYAAKMAGNPNPFDTWDINQRYAQRSYFTQGMVENHQKAAKTTMELLQTAILNGDVV